MPRIDYLSQEELEDTEKKLSALTKNTKGKRQTLPPQDQPPFDEAVLTSGNIFRVFQRLQNGIFAIFGQLYGSDGVTSLSETIPLSNSTAHRIWPRVTPMTDGGANVFYVAYGTGADEVYLQPCNSMGNPTSSAQQIPLLGDNLWALGNAANPTSYSVDFDLSSNRTYVWVKGQRRVTINTPDVIWGIYFDGQGTPYSNQHIAAGNGENFPVVSRTALAHSYDNIKNDIILYPTAPKGIPTLTITSARGNSLNRLNIGMLNNGSRMFVWQQNGGKVYFRRLTAGPTYSWLDAANGIVVYTLPGANGEPHPNVIASSDAYYIVGREAPGNSSVGVYVRKYWLDVNGTLINPTPNPMIVFNDTQAQFPRGIMLSNGKLCISACQMVAGDCVALIINPDALNSRSTMRVTSTTSSSRAPITDTTNSNASLTAAITTLLDLTAKTSSSNSLSSATSSMVSPFSFFDTPTTTSMLALTTPNDSDTLANVSSMSPTKFSGESTPINNTAAIAGAAVGGSVGTLLLVGFFAGWRWMRGKNRENEKQVGSMELGKPEKELETARYSSVSTVTAPPRYSNPPPEQTDPYAGFKFENQDGLNQLNRAVDEDSVQQQAFDNNYKYIPSVS